MNIQQAPNTRTHRDANIDLLRIVATLFVILLHYNNVGGGKAFLYTENLGYHFQILLLLESFAICAVNIFVLITGYYQSSGSSVSLAKPFVLLAELAFFTVMRYLTSCALGSVEFSAFSLIRCLLPTNWYVIVYIALYLLSPYINASVKSLTRNQCRVLLIVLFVIASLWAYSVDVMNSALGLEISSPLGGGGSDNGYTLVNFVLLYLIGGYLRKVESEHRLKCKALVVGTIYVIATLAIFVLSRFSFAWGLSYCSPFVIVQSVCLFVLFQKLNLKNKIISSVAKVSFGVYLIHGFFYPYVNVKAQVTGNMLLIPVYAVVACIGIYLASGIIYKLYTLTMGKAVVWISKFFKKIAYGIGD